MASDAPRLDTWVEKKTVGDAGELLTLHYLTKVLKKQVERSSGFDREKDFVINGVNVELKSDIYAAKSGQIMVEKTSLFDHTAPFIVYMVPEFYVGKRSDLIEWYGRVQDKPYLIGDDKREGQPLIISSPMFTEIFRPLR